MLYSHVLFCTLLYSTILYCNLLILYPTSTVLNCTLSRQLPFFLEMGDDMSCKVQVCPPPKPYSKAEDFTVVKRELSSTLSIKGKHDALFILYFFFWFLMNYFDKFSFLLFYFSFEKKKIIN